jgi:hypothetical protein
MNRKTFFARWILFVLAFFVAGKLSRAQQAQHLSFGRVEQWVVSAAADDQDRRSSHAQIAVHPGDRILLSAGGCDETNRIDCGLITIPGLGEMTAQDFLDGHQEGFVISRNNGALRTHFRQERNVDRKNLYLSVGNGTANASPKNGNAWVSVTIIHP